MAYSLFKFIKKSKQKKMSDAPSTPGFDPSAGPFGPSPTTSDTETLFRQVYECTKLNENWPKVSNALKAHPDWLTRIPQGRRWTMLHQIVFSGNRQHLDEVLAYQLDNPQFRFLCKAADDKTVREVATDRAHIHPQMIRHVERYVFCDQILNNANDGKWELVKQSVRQKPDLANEKPPYRREYLIHHLAAKGRLNEFKELNQIVQLKLNVVADGKTVSELARQNGHQEFANYIETLLPSGATGGSSGDGDGDDDGGSSAAATSTSSSSGGGGAAANPTGQPKYSPGFYDDVSISIMPPGMSFSTMSFSSPGGPAHYFGPPAGPNHHYAVHSMYQGPHPVHHTSSLGSSGSASGGGAGASGGSYHGGSAKKKSMPKAMSEDEQSKYEKAVTSNADKVVGSQILDSMTCCITKQILRDPVVAADGFTYEREAILKWFEHSTRSPMTNQELDNKDLKPNHALKSILNSLHSGSKGSADKSKDKDSPKK